MINSTDIPTEVLAALARLNASEDFLRVLKCFEDEMVKSDQESRTQEGAMLHRSQGRSLTYAAILELAKDATKTIHKRRR